MHVWSIRLAGVDPGLDAVLSGPERKRAQRIAAPTRARRFAAGRAALRTLLGHYLGCEAGEVSLQAGDHGKPFIATGEVGFNLSHSDDRAVCAFTRGGEVGIDIQQPRAWLRRPGAAARLFGAAAEVEASRLEPHSSLLYLTRLWARREATAKWHGGGLAATPETSDEPWVGDLPSIGGAVAAIALDRAPERSLRVLTWPAGGVCGARPSRPGAAAERSNLDGSSCRL